MNWRGFDLSHLRSFVAVAEAGSVSAGSEQVFLSQSSVSEQLKKLEERAGQPLFVRSKQGVSATQAGARLLDHARRILAMSEAAFDDLQGHSLDGELRIAITDYYRPHDIARILKTFSEQYPRLKLHVTVLPSAAIDESAGGDAAFDIGLSLRLVTPGNRRDAAYSARAQGIVVLFRSLSPGPAAVHLPVAALCRQTARRTQGALSDRTFSVGRRGSATCVESGARDWLPERIVDRCWRRRVCSERGLAGTPLGRISPAARAHRRKRTRQQCPRRFGATV